MSTALETVKADIEEMKESLRKIQAEIRTIRVKVIETSTLLSVLDDDVVQFGERLIEASEKLSQKD